MRYFFHIRDGIYVIPDEEGSELPDMQAARHEAHLTARDFAMDSLRQNLPANGRAIEISDGDGTVLETLFVRDAFLR